MPEATVLYSVTAAVVLGLVTWVAVVLKTAKEPWARDLPKSARADDDVPLEPPAEPAEPAENEMTSEEAPARVTANAADANAPDANENADEDKAEEKV